MKTKVTKSQVRQNFKTILSIGYCDIQYLTQYKKPFAYSSGADGWSCDYYEIENTCLSTGYSPIGKNVNWELIKKYEAKARKIVDNYELGHKAQVKKIDKLLIEFINKHKETI